MIYRYQLTYLTLRHTVSAEEVEQEVVSKATHPAGGARARASLYSLTPHWLTLTSRVVIAEHLTDWPTERREVNLQEPLATGTMVIMNRSPDSRT
ncbi:unnamed protein product [Leuciscus chuanchicus]